MKSFFILVIFFSTTGYTYPQDYPNSFGPAPVSDNKVATAPSPFSTIGTRAFTQVSSSPTYQFGKCFMENCTITNIGAPFTITFPGGLMYRNGTVYTWNQSSPFQLWSIDTVTGTHTLVFNITGTTQGNLTGMYWDGTTVYCVSSSLTVSQIYSVNWTTGIATPIGTASATCAGAIFLAGRIGANNSAYSVDIVGDNVFKWNKNTGTATLIGPLGVDANYGQDAGFDPSDGALYWMSYTTGPQLRKIDTATGFPGTILCTYTAQGTGIACVPNGPPPLPPYFCNSGISYVPITGTNGPSGDDAILNVPIGFSFFYDGTTYTTVTISTNGYGILGASTFNSFTPDLCQTTTGSFPMLAPFWVDLIASAGQIVYTVIGSAPYRVFVVQYTNVPYFSGTGSVTMQLRLRETANAIDFIYGNGSGSSLGQIGINRNPGGSGNIINVRPGSTCGSTTTSTTSCLSNYWVMSLGNHYCFGGCIIDPILNNMNELSNQYSLSQNYPNPFNPTTVISYGLPKSGNVELKIYDVLGREVKTLVNEFKPAGSYDITFDASEFASGLYFYTIKVDGGSTGSPRGYSETKKMLLIK